MENFLKILGIVLLIDLIIGLSIFYSFGITSDPPFLAKLLGDFITLPIILWDMTFPAYRTAGSSSGLFIGFILVANAAVQALVVVGIKAFLKAMNPNPSLA